MYMTANPFIARQCDQAGENACLAPDRDANPSNSIPADDGQTSALVEELRNITLAYHDSTQLRERIAGVIVRVKMAPSKEETSHAYRMINTFLRNGLGARDYRKYESALETITQYRESET